MDVVVNNTRRAFWGASFLTRPVLCQSLTEKSREIQILPLTPANPLTPSPIHHGYLAPPVSLCLSCSRLPGHSRLEVKKIK